MHYMNSLEGLDLATIGKFPPGIYIVDDLNASQFLEFGRRGMTQLSWFSKENEKPFDSKQDYNGKSILIVRGGGFGDIMFTTPVMREMKLRWPKCRIGFACLSHYKAVLENCPYVDEVLKYPLALNDAKKYDAWIFLENSIEAGGEAEKIHAVDITAKHMGFSPDVLTNKQMFYRVSKEESDWANRNFPRNHGIKRIAIQMNASAPVRNYPGPLLLETIVRLCGLGFEVYLLGNPSGPAKKIHDNCINLAERKLDFRASMAVMSQCDCLLGPDSVGLHVAGAIGMNAVGLFGPFDGALRLGYAPSVKWLQGRGGCSIAPCFYHQTRISPAFPFDGPCHKTGRCEALASITVNDVIDAVIAASETQ